MADYTPSFTAAVGATKDSTNATVQGSELGTEYDNIATAVASKLDDIAGGTNANLVQIGSSGQALADSGVGIGDVVTLTGTETLTNKTLTSPTINDPTFNSGTTIPFRGALVTTTLVPQSVAANYTPVVWDTEEYDTDAIHDNSTNKERLTVPAGVSRVKLTFNFSWVDDASFTFLEARIYKNDAVFSGAPAVQLEPSSIVSNERFNMKSAALAVSPGDYFTAVVRTNLTANAGGASDPMTWFAMELVE